MKIVWIGGNHRRHLYYANSIHKSHQLAGMIIEARDEIVPKPPGGIGEMDGKNFIRHFENRDNAERKYFGVQDFPDCPALKLERDKLNSRESAEFIKFINPDVVLTYGCHLIKEPLFSALPPHSINLHGGLSPKYRGTATLFWPFYFMEPAYAGSTFHYLTVEPDAGDIIHQTVPRLGSNDGIHDVACKTILASAKDILRLLDIFKADGRWMAHPQKWTGRNFVSKDFRPEHLRVIYNLFNDDIVRFYLEGKLGASAPKLIKQF